MQLNVDDKTSVREMPYVMELWKAVKFDSMPETVYVHFPPSEQLPLGRDVRIRIEDWDGRVHGIDETIEVPGERGKI